jgi:hypothetical protein
VGIGSDLEEVVGAVTQTGILRFAALRLEGRTLEAT